MDNMGKTTLCEKLSRELNILHIKSQGPNQTKGMMLYWMDECLIRSENLIIERFPFFEEMVYGHILRGESKFTFRDREFQKIKEENPLIIYCKVNKFTIGQKEEMDGVIENQKALNKQWRKVIRKLKSRYNNVIEYNYQQDPEAKELLNVIRSL